MTEQLPEIPEDAMKQLSELPLPDNSGMERKRLRSENEKLKAELTERTEQRDKCGKIAADNIVKWSKEKKRSDEAEKRGQYQDGIHTKEKEWKQSLTSKLEATEKHNAELEDQVARLKAEASIGYWKTYAKATDASLKFAEEELIKRTESFQFDLARKDEALRRSKHALYMCAAVDQGWQKEVLGCIKVINVALSPDPSWLEEHDRGVKAEAYARGRHDALAEEDALLKTCPGGRDEDGAMHTIEGGRCVRLNCSKPWRGRDAECVLCGKNKANHFGPANQCSPSSTSGCFTAALREAGKREDA